MTTTARIALYDGMHLLYPLVEESGGIVLGSPTYNRNITPEVKSSIARLASEGRRLLAVGGCG